MELDNLTRMDRLLSSLATCSTNEQLQVLVNRNLVWLLEQVQNDQLRTKAFQILTHVNKIIKPNKDITVPVGDVITLFLSSIGKSFTLNFSLVYISMGYSRLPTLTKIELLPSLFKCIKIGSDSQKRKFLVEIVSQLGLVASDPNCIVSDQYTLGLDELPEVEDLFCQYATDILIFPYIFDHYKATNEVPPGMSERSFKMILDDFKDLTVEGLQQYKADVVYFLGYDLIKIQNKVLPLLVGCADTRFTVATPALDKLNRISLDVNWTDSIFLTKLYNLFTGTTAEPVERRLKPASLQLKRRLLFNLVKNGGGVLLDKSNLQVIFEAFSEYSNQHIKLGALKLAQIWIKNTTCPVIKECSDDFLEKLIRKSDDESEPVNVRCELFRTLANFAENHIETFRKRLNLIISLFHHIAEPMDPDLQSAIQNTMVSISPAFSFTDQLDPQNPQLEIKTRTNSDDGIDAGAFLLLLRRYIEGQSLQTMVAAKFLINCFPPYFIPARYLLLLATRQVQIQEFLYEELYGCTKKKSLDYDIISSIDFPIVGPDRINSTSNDRHNLQIVLPSFVNIVPYVTCIARERKLKPDEHTFLGGLYLPYDVELYREIIQYMNLCMMFSAGINKPLTKDTIPILGKFLHSLRTLYPSVVDDFVSFTVELLIAAKGPVELSCLLDIIGCYQTIELKFVDEKFISAVETVIESTIESNRINGALLYAMVMSRSNAFTDINNAISKCMTLSKTSRSLEGRHGYILALGYLLERTITRMKREMSPDILQWSEYKSGVALLLEHLMSNDSLIVSGACLAIGCIGRCYGLPLPDGTEDSSDQSTLDLALQLTKLSLVKKLFQIAKSSCVTLKVQREAIETLGYIAIGESMQWTNLIIEHILGTVKESKDVDLHLAMGLALVNCVQSTNSKEGRDYWTVLASEYKPTHLQRSPDTNQDMETVMLNHVLDVLIKDAEVIHPNSRQACAIWLLALVKSCSLLQVKNRLPEIQQTFTRLATEDNDIVQDTASRGLAIVYMNCDSEMKNELSNELLGFLTGQKKIVKRVDSDTVVYDNNSLGEDLSGGKLSTYKELCSLATDLNKPDLIYKFMQLANHNASWNSKLGAAFGLQSINEVARAQIEPLLPQIVPKLYRFKFDPFPNMQQSMASIWAVLVPNEKATIVLYYDAILIGLVNNLINCEWRVRLSCCLAIQDLIRIQYISDPVIVSRLWNELFRVSDDIHEATRVAAQTTTKGLSQMCISIFTSDSTENLSISLATNILPVLLEYGITNVVPETRNTSLKTISELVKTSKLLKSGIYSQLVPALLTAAGELEEPEVSHLSTMLGAHTATQEILDSSRAEAARTHFTTKTVARCVQQMNDVDIKNTNRVVIDLINNSCTLGTRVACAHYFDLVFSQKKCYRGQLQFNGLDSALLRGLVDRNAAVRKCYSETLGALCGFYYSTITREVIRSLTNIYDDKAYNYSRLSVARAMRSINKYCPLEDHGCIAIPFVFFAMHEDITPENNEHVTIFKSLWDDMCSGVGGYREYYPNLIKYLLPELKSSSWITKAQAAAAIGTLADKLHITLSAMDRKEISTHLLTGLKGRTWKGKFNLLNSLRIICLTNSPDLCDSNEYELDQRAIVNALFIEINKTANPQYRQVALGVIGDIIEHFKVDRFDDLYNALENLIKLEIGAMESLSIHDSPEERIETRKVHVKLQEAAWLALGKAWPYDKEGQEKYIEIFPTSCINLLKISVLTVQINIMIALNMFIKKLVIDITEENKNIKKVFIKTLQDSLTSLIATVLGATKMKMEALELIINWDAKIKDEIILQEEYAQFKSSLRTILPNFEDDRTPEIQLCLSKIQELTDYKTQS